MSHLCGFCCLLLVATSATWLNEVDVREIHDMVACRCDRQTVLVAQSNVACKVFHRQRLQTVSVADVRQSVSRTPTWRCQHLLCICITLVLAVCVTRVGVCTHTTELVLQAMSSTQTHTTTVQTHIKYHIYLQQIVLLPWERRCPPSCCIGKRTKEENELPRLLALWRH